MAASFSTSTRALDGNCLWVIVSLELGKLHNFLGFKSIISTQQSNLVNTGIVL